jgi:alpha-ketoglutarate-dependent taurine dioxygenase
MSPPRPSRDDTATGPSTMAWDATSFSFGEHELVLSDAAVAALQRCLGSIDPTAPAVQPTAKAARPLAEELLDARLRLVDGWPGYLVLTGLAAIPPEQWRPAFRVVSAILGSIQPQDASGLEVREVQDRGTRIGEGRTARYADSRLGGSLHTDGAESPFPLPDYFTLCCVRKAARGGAFQMVSAESVYRRLLDRAPELVQTLREPYHFDRRGDPGPDGSLTVAKPIFFERGGRLHVTYLRDYVEIGHGHEEIADLTTTQRAALDALDAELNDPGLVVQGYLEPGQVLVIDNQRILHGRTPFEDEPDPARKRLLLRIWLRRHEGPEPPGDPGEV